jgi:hypothetical protein
MCIGAVSSGIRRLERETDHLPPSSDEVKNLARFAFSPPIRRHLQRQLLIPDKKWCLRDDVVQKLPLAFYSYSALEPIPVYCGSRSVFP